jgi:hypothetical protein
MFRDSEIRARGLRAALGEMLPRLLERNCVLRLCTCQRLNLSGAELSFFVRTTAPLFRALHLPKRCELCPSNLRMHSPAETTVRSGEHVFTINNLREPDESVSHKLRMLQNIGRVTDQARDQKFCLEAASYFSIPSTRARDARCRPPPRRPAFTVRDLDADHASYPNKCGSGHDLPEFLLTHGLRRRPGMRPICDFNENHQS